MAFGWKHLLRAWTFDLAIYPHKNTDRSCLKKNLILLNKYAKIREAAFRHGPCLKEGTNILTGHTLYILCWSVYVTKI